MIKIAAYFSLIFSVILGSCDNREPLKVYIMAGQSNMQGSAHQRTFEVLGDDPETVWLLEKITDKNGEPVVCNNAFITYATQKQGEDTTLNGKVSVGYGFDHERIGPEYAFGLFMDEVHEEPVLIIKTAWGGKSLAVDFRPPGAGPYAPDEVQVQRGNIPGKEEIGLYYRKMMQHIRETLGSTDNIRKIVPGYDASRGYELAGFVWFQGWNDMISNHYTAQYSRNMIHFIEDVRKELNDPKLPFVIGILGVHGTDPGSNKFINPEKVIAFRKAQFSAVEQYDQEVPALYQGNVTAVDSGPFYELELADIYWKRRFTNQWKRELDEGKISAEEMAAKLAQYGFKEPGLTPEEQAIWDREASNAEYHYLGSGKTFIRLGKALADAMLEMERYE